LVIDRKVYITSAENRLAMPKSLLTSTERMRLTNRIPDPQLSNDEKEKFKNALYNNDMIVRNKIRTWMKESDDILFVLKHMPTRKLRKIISDDEIFRLFHLGLYLIDAFGFQPVDEIENNKPRVVIGSSSDPSILSLDEIWLRPATNEEINRNLRLRQIIAYLERFVTRKDLLEALDKMYAEIYREEEAEWKRTSDNSHDE
jgi:hypothetical protein